MQNKILLKKTLLSLAMTNFLGFKRKIMWHFLKSTWGWGGGGGRWVGRDRADSILLCHVSKLEGSEVELEYSLKPSAISARLWSTDRLWNTGKHCLIASIIATLFVLDTIWEVKRFLKSLNVQSLVRKEQYRSSLLEDCFSSSFLSLSWRVVSSCEPWTLNYRANVEMSFCLR